MNAIELKDVTKKYKKFQLDHLNLTLPAGCILGLIGENGAGKSTTIKLLLDMIQGDGGTITLLGQEHTKCDKEDIGVVMDEVNFPDCLTVKNVGSIMKDVYRNWQQDKFEELVEKLDLPMKQPFKEFSRGMKMKLGIAVALSHQAKLLILDEATGGLDPVVRDEVLDLLLDFTREENHSILMSSHIVSDLEKVCDYIAFLKKGRLLLCEEKDMLYEQYGMVRCTAEDMKVFAEDAVIGKRESAYGVEAIVKKDRIPAGWATSPVNIEELFVLMAKEGR